MNFSNSQADDSKTRELVGECIKQAFGNLKDYLDSNLSKQRQESERLLQSTSQQVSELKKTAELQFKFKGNKTQFVFNSGIIEQLKLIDELISDQRVDEVQQQVQKTLASLKKRNKLIRLADKSEGGM